MNILRFSLCLLLGQLLFQNRLAAQCPITVSAGPDQFVCNSGSATVLNGSIGGPYLGFLWSPATGLNDPTLISPTATVTGPATYTLTAQAVDPSALNMVNNPGFESGNSGFSSNYTYNPLPVTPGTYVLTTSPALVLASFPPCDDHTFGNGTGNMMLINGNASTGAQAWCQTINVTPNTWYVMSAWAMASPLFPPTLQFSVNNALVGNPFPVGTGTCNWQEFSASWYSGSATTATLCITDQISGGNGFFGDDYALDDIFFAAACSVSDEVNVDVAEVEAILPIDVALLCNATQTGVELDGSASTTGPNVTYQWTGPGIISGANTPIATVNQVGNYTLTLVMDIGPTNCQVSESIEVVGDPNFVVAVAAVDEDITCDQPTVFIDGTGTSIGATISYNWDPVNAVVNGQGTLSPEVNESGLYTLTVSNSFSGCTATATAFVNQNITPPTAAASAPTPLSCAMSEVTLSGNGSSTGPNFDYLWTGPGIVSGEDLLNNCVVNLPGLYILTVTNTVNGCTATASATVTENGATPVAVANVPAPGSVDCDTPSLTLNSTGSSTGMGISYAWTTVGGHFNGPTNGQTANIDEGGTYTLFVINSLGCIDTAVVTVAENFANPTAGIALPVPSFLCNTDSVQLNASQSNSGMGFSLAWTSQNGTFLSGSTTLTPWVGSAGTYTLTITNTNNGCTATASATVTANTTPPIAQAGTNATLDCNGSSLTLNGSGSSTGTGFLYLWTTNGGNIEGGDTTLMPQVNGIGTYYLTVQNSLNNCTATDSVSVAQDANAPVVDIELPGQLDCDTDELVLDASGSSSGANIALTWAGPGFVNGQNTLTPTVNLPGIYQLSLLNQTNNCVTIGSVTVTQDLTPPLADAGPVPSLNCTAQPAILDGNGSSQGPNFTYLWTGGGTSITDTVSADGTYYITVTNSATACTAVDSVIVASFGSLPSVAIAQPPSLNCTNPEIQLAATASMGAEYGYQWTFTGTGVGIVAGDTTLAPTIGSPGIYTLTVTNTLTGCSASDAVTVAQSAGAPVADAGAPQIMACGQSSLLLDGSLSSSGLSYLWTTLNGNILNGETTTSPEVNAPGLYTLTVTNLQNGCTASDDVQVGQDANSPIADAGAPQSLTCSVFSVTLDGTGSSSGPGISYLWTTTDGTIFTGATTLTPVVTAAGTYLLTVSNSINNCQTLSSVQVDNQNQPPDAVAAVPQSLGCNALTVILNGTGSTTGPGILYQWTGPGIQSGGNTLMPVVDAPGVYTFTVTNTVTDCSTVAQVTVLENNIPPVAVATAPQNLDCLAQQVQLGGTGSTVVAVTYLWTGPGIVSGATSLSPTVNAPGVYTLTITNTVGGCTATATATVLQNTTPPVALVAAPQSLTCIAQQTILNGTGSSTGAGIVYQWAGPGIVSGGTTLSPTVNLPGLYTLTVTNQSNHCTAMATANVSQSNTPPVALAAASQSLDCTHQQVSLSGTGSSTGAGIGYQWAGPGIVSGGTGLSPLVDAPGNYTLTVSNQSNGCTATATVSLAQNVTLPTVNVGPGFFLDCDTEQGELHASTDAPPGSTYAWVFAPAPGVVGPGIISGNISPAPWVNLPGTYTVTVTSNGTGCTASASVVVGIDTLAPTVDAGLPFSLSCNQGSVTLQGSTNATNPAFQWASLAGGFVSGQSTANPVVDAPGTYVLVVQNLDNGCTAADSTVVDESLAIFPEAETIQPNCKSPTGSFEFIGGQGGAVPFVYSLDGGATTTTVSLFENQLPGNYEVLVQDANGCEQIYELVLLSGVQLTISLESETTVEPGGNYQIVPSLSIPDSLVASVVWSPADGLSCADCLFPIASPTADIAYTLTVTSLDGCTASDSITIAIVTPGSIFVPNAFSPNDDGINDLLAVFADEKLVTNIISFQVFSRWGESIFEGYDLRPNEVSTGWDGTFRGKKVDVGVYAWFAEVELASGEKKVVKGDVVVVR